MTDDDIADLVGHPDTEDWEYEAAAEYRDTWEYEATPEGKPRERSEAEQQLIDDFSEIFAQVSIVLIDRYITPFIKRKTTAAWQWTQAKFRRPKGSKSKALTGNVQVDRPEEATETVIVPDEAITMSQEEYRDRFLSMVAAKAYFEEQEKILRAARVDSDQSPPELAAIVQLALEGRAAELDENQLQVLATFLGVKAQQPDPAALERAVQELPS